MQTAFIVLSNIFVFIAYAVYGWSIVVGKTKPHRTTRVVLLVITSLGALSLLAADDRVAVWLIGLCAIFSLIIFLLSLKYGMGGWAKIDIACLVIAILGIVLWQITDNPALGLYASVTADFVGMVPALIKTYRFPHTEYYLAYVFDILAGLFTVLAIQSWDIMSLTYPAYIFIINLAMMLLALRKVDGSKRLKAR